MRTTVAAIGLMCQLLFAMHPVAGAEPQRAKTAALAANSNAAQPPATSLATPNAAPSAVKSKDSASPSAKNETRAKQEVAVFAGGCFWCIELTFEQIKGVIDVENGYCGGTKATANYERVHRGNTHHAEAVRVTYDPSKIRYDQLLDVFFDAHDPTQYNRQGDDEGRQYRSAIFFANDEQKQQAEQKMKQLKADRVFARHIVTKLEKLDEFYPAEAYHQNFALLHLEMPYIQEHAVPQACTVRMRHPELLRQDR